MTVCVVKTILSIVVTYYNDVMRCERIRNGYSFGTPMGSQGRLTVE